MKKDNEKSEEQKTKENNEVKDLFFMYIERNVGREELAVIFYDLARSYTQLLMNNNDLSCLKEEAEHLFFLYDIVDILNNRKDLKNRII